LRRFDSHTPFRIRHIADATPFSDSRFQPSFHLPFIFSFSATRGLASARPPPPPRRPPHTLHDYDTPIADAAARASQPRFS